MACGCADLFVGFERQLADPVMAGDQSAGAHLRHRLGVGRPVRRLHGRQRSAALPRRQRRQRRPAPSRGPFRASLYFFCAHGTG